MLQRTTCLVVQNELVPCKHTQPVKRWASRKRSISQREYFFSTRLPDVNTLRRHAMPHHQRYHISAGVGRWYYVAYVFMQFLYMADTRTETGAIGMSECPLYIPRATPEYIILTCCTNKYRYLVICCHCCPRVWFLVSPTLTAG